MKIYTLILFTLIITSCSKDGPMPTGPGPDNTAETSERIALEEVNKLQQLYLSSQKTFNESKQERLQTQIDLFKQYQNNTKAYLNVLSIISNQDEKLKVQTAFEEDFNVYEGIKGLLEKYSESLDSLNSSYKEINQIQKKTDNFLLTKITELGIRDSLLESLSTYEQSAEYLRLTFSNEFNDDELENIHDRLQKNQEIQWLFVPYFNLLEVLDSAEETLEKVDFNINDTDHSVAALTHEEKFFKALEQYLESLEVFIKDASLYLDLKDLESLNALKLKVSSTLKDLSKLRN